LQRFLGVPVADLYYVLSDDETYLFRTTVLMKNCYLQRQRILDLEVRVQDKSKLKTFVD